MPRGFTAAELAEMAAADAEIEASFQWTNEELALSRELDAEAVLSAKDGQARKRSAQQKAYREANREKVAASQKAYREANREKRAEYQKAYREANREKVAEYQKAYYEANREKGVAAGRRIADARRAAGYTQAALAKLLHVSQPALSQWETGAVPPRWELLRQVLPDLGEEAERMPDMLRDAQDETPAAYCYRCGGEVWQEEYRVRWDGRWICPDCFRAEVERMLDEEPKQLALDLNADFEVYL